MPLELTQATPSITRDVVFMTIYGATSTGRTTFALTAPGPILYLHASEKYEGAVARELERSEGKAIHVGDFGFTGPLAGNDSQLSTEARKTFNSFAETILDGMTWAKTVIVDTHTAAYELLRFARFGKLTQVQPWHYAPLNDEWLRLFGKFRQQNRCNFIGVGKTKEEYRGDKGTGRMVQSGQKEMGEGGYLADVVLESYRRKDKKTGEVTYGVRVEKGWDMDDVYYGMEFDNGDFAGVMGMLSPQNAGVWG